MSTPGPQCSKSPTPLGPGLRIGLYTLAFCYVVLGFLQRLSGERGREDSRRQPSFAVITWASLFGQLVFTVQENQVSFIEEKVATHLLFIPVCGALTAYVVTKLTEDNPRWLTHVFLFLFGGTTCWVVYRCLFIYFHGCQTSNGLSPSMVIWILFFRWRLQGTKIVWTCIVCFANILVLLPPGRPATSIPGLIIVLVWWVFWFGHEIVSIEYSLGHNYIDGVNKSAWGVGQAAAAIAALRSILDICHTFEKMLRSREEVVFIMDKEYVTMSKQLLEESFDEIEAQLRHAFKLQQLESLKIGTSIIESANDWDVWQQAIQVPSPQIIVAGTRR